MTSVVSYVDILNRRDPEREGRERAPRHQLATVIGEGHLYEVFADAIRRYLAGEDLSELAAEWIVCTEDECPRFAETWFDLDDIEYAILRGIGDVATEVDCSDVGANKVALSLGITDEQSTAAEERLRRRA